MFIEKDVDVGSKTRLGVATRNDHEAIVKVRPENGTNTESKDISQSDAASLGSSARKVRCH